MRKLEADMRLSKTDVDRRQALIEVLLFRPLRTAVFLLPYLSLSLSLSLALSLLSLRSVLLLASSLYRFSLDAKASLSVPLFYPAHSSRHRASWPRSVLRI